MTLRFCYCYALSDFFLNTSFFFVENFELEIQVVVENGGYVPVDHFDNALVGLVGRQVEFEGGVGDVFWEPAVFIIFKFF